MIKWHVCRLETVTVSHGGRSDLASGAHWRRYSYCQSCLVRCDGTVTLTSEPQRSYFVCAILNFEKESKREFQFGNNNFILFSFKDRIISLFFSKIGIKSVCFFIYYWLKISFLSLFFFSILVSKFLSNFSLDIFNQS